MTIHITISIYFLVAFNLVIHTSVYSQTSLPRNYIPPSPTAANLGLYAAVPVNYYTGVPEISIPITSVKIKNVDLNIQLSYHANAVRKADEASWVGLGWSLMAGGVVTRTKRHKDDLSDKGFYKYNASNRPCNDDYDQEPDLFLFNFAGRTGKFFLESTTNGQPVISSVVKDMLRIKITATGGWEVTDENGTVYQFEAKEWVREEYTAGKKHETETFVASWYLTRITNAFNESIDFTYTTTTGSKIYKKTNYASYKQLSGYAPAYLFDINVMFGDKNGVQQYAELAGTKVTELSTSETYTDEVVPAGISFPGGTIEFVSGDRSDLYLSSPGFGKKLDRIVIRTVAAGEEPFKTYKLGYTYFSSRSSQPNSISTRLELIELRETAQNISQPPYKFSYREGVVPDKQNTTSLGGFFDDVAACLLSNITYPTGGYTLFTFEPNIQRIGARIKRVEHKDPDASVGIRLYEYAGGRLLANSLPINGADQSGSVTGTMYNGATPLTVYGTLAYKTFMSSDQCLMGESSGDYLVGYDKVTEYMGETGEWGKTEYTFFNEASPLAYGVPAEVPALNGSLRITEEYINKGGAFLSSKKTVRETVAEPASTLAVKRRFQNACSNNYSLRTNRIMLQKETAFNFDDGSNPVVQSTSYVYANPAHTFPTAIKTTDSKENTWQTNYKYPLEKAVEEGGVYIKMVSRNIVSPVCEETKKTGETLLSTVRTNYREWTAGVLAPETEEFKKGEHTSEIRLRFYNYDAKGNPLEVSKEHDLHTAYIWDPTVGFPTAQATNCSAADLAYTSFETTEAGGNYNVPAAGLTSEDAFTGTRSFNLNNILLGNKTGPTFYLSGSAPVSIVSFWAKGGTPMISYKSGPLPKSLLLSSAYKKGTAVNGWTRFEIVLTNLSSVSVLGSGLIDEFRVYPKGAWMNTYTYLPIVGMTGECDKNNRVIRYGYDGFGRLQAIRDHENNIVKTFEYHIRN